MKRKLRPTESISNSMLDYMLKACSKCKSTKTAIDRHTQKPIWTKNLCKKCYNQVRHRINNPLRSRIDGFVRYFKKEPRNGICQNCGRSIHQGQITRTALCLAESGIDAGKATLDEILKYSKEYCLRCHTKTHFAVKKALRDNGLNF